MASATERKSRPHSKYCTSYNESLKNLKDSIIQDGRLSATELQRCLLINGVPMQDCPTSDQLLERLGLFHLPQDDAYAHTGTFGRIKRRSSLRLKRHKSKNKQNEDGIPTHDNQDTDYLIMQLLHSCCQLVSLEATNQTPAHVPLSTNRVPGGEMETSSKCEKMEKEEKSIVNRKDSSKDSGKQSITYDSIGLEFCYMEPRDRNFPTEAETTLRPLEDATPQISQETDRELFLLRHENLLLLRKLNTSESYTEHLESKCDALYAKLGTSQTQLSKLQDKQSNCESIPEIEMG